MGVCGSICLDLLYIINIADMYIEIRAYCVIVKVWVYVHVMICAFACLYIGVRVCGWLSVGG